MSGLQQYGNADHPRSRRRLNPTDTGGGATSRVPDDLFDVSERYTFAIELARSKGERAEAGAALAAART